MAKKEKYFVGSASIYGKMIVKPANLTEFPKKDFFELIDAEQPNSGLEKSKYFAEVRKKKNLKKGITVGSQFFITTYEQ